MLIWELKKQASLEVDDAWTMSQSKISELGDQRLTFSYRVVCDPTFYGPQCAVLCAPRDDKFGHYTCTENGTKACRDGWQGDYCDQGTWRSLLTPSFIPW